MVGSGSGWRFWIDRGGTFTDCIGRDPQGRVHVVKLLSSDAAPLRGIRRLLKLSDDAPIPGGSSVRMGTTLATNALLERAGAATGLVISRGFGDLLEIGDQARPELFALAIRKQAPLTREVLEVDARVTPTGELLARPDAGALRQGLLDMLSRGVQSLAVAVLHAYTPAGAALERELGALATALGFSHVTLSHEVADGQGLLARVETAVTDAYLTPPLREHVRELARGLTGSRLLFMQSSGDLCDASRFRGRDAILSGPAGGVVAVAQLARDLARDLELSQVIGFDMGGTSTDVCRYAGAFERSYETRVAGVRVRTPMIAIHTVAAGGGSICAYDGRRLSVGPRSVGADPGPLCYGRPGAGPLALTDISLALGRVLPHRFPFPLARGRVDAALDELAEKTGMDAPAVAQGFFEVAVASMAAAIRAVSVARGHDVREHAMVVFGGAGGQYACAVARELGVRTLVFHPLAGVLSALGMGVARLGWHGEADAGRRPVTPVALESLEPIFAALERRGRAALERDGVAGETIRSIRRVDLRYRGTQTPLTVALPAREQPPPARLSALLERFTAAHRRGFGYAREDHPVELVSARVELRDAGAAEADTAAAAAAQEVASGHTRGAAPPCFVTLWAEGRRHEHVPVLLREALFVSKGSGKDARVIEGPALILEATATIVLDPDWVLEPARGGCLIARDRRPRATATRTREAAREAPDPVRLEIMGNRFMAIAEEMGVVLQRTAMSTNIRERLDFSCAVFDRRGGLVANAPHIPVHLGAMSESIRGVLAAHPEPQPGEVFATNDPAAGGSHLPDITVISPVHGADGALLFFTASRGHHADIGGIRPGSIPPRSSSLEQEGVVLRALPIVRGGALERALLLRVLRGGRFPARDPAQNIADLAAQIAANQAGARGLLTLARELGAAAVAASMGHVQDHGAACVAEAIAALEPGARSFEDAMDDGTPIRVRVTVTGARMEIDFAGTGPQQARGNLNAPRAVTVAAVLYVLRLLARRPIPLNEGCLRPVSLRIPEGSLLAPAPGLAVAAGNVETAQRVVDVLLGALGLAAASQGTMNNLTFGADDFGYYETIGGGAGASAGALGASCVHTHMTNTRITDPEVLEARFPVRVRAFARRRGSGGAGRYRGGDGLVRELEFLRAMQVAILSERRERAPFGLRGGGAGAPGRNLHNGREVPGRFELDVAVGDRLRIETPGGGGFGAA